MRLQLAAVFSDYCVLQREKEIAIFGSAPNGEEIRISLAGETLLEGKAQESHGVTQAENGVFLAKIPPLAAGLHHTLTVTCKEESITLREIAIGEVWLAGGQSNMEFELRNCTEAAVLQKPYNSNIRFYYTQKKAYIDDAFLKTERETKWECFGDPGTVYWSAVGYFFAERLQDTLNVPVGILGCNWGGTSATNWIPYADVAEEKVLQVYLEEFLTETAGKTLEEQKAIFEEYRIHQENFDKRASKIYAEEPEIEWAEVEKRAGGSRYPGPINSFNPLRPGGLYECMLRRIMPYSLRGFLYYQGESDDPHPELYEGLFTKLIRRWRSDWQEDTLPFVYAQLPMHRYRQDPDWKNWCGIRQAQQNVRDKVSNTAMTDIIDQGVYDDIHPKAKRIVGRRMCAQALALVYGRTEEDALYPEITGAEIAEKEICLSVKHGESLYVTAAPDQVCKNYEPPLEGSYGFGLVLRDGSMVTPLVRVEESQIVIPLPDSCEVCEVRYLWTNYGDVRIFNQNKMPLIPGRILL